MKRYPKIMLEDSFDYPKSCPNCSALFNVSPVTGERDITGDGRHEQMLWQCDDCQTQWLIEVDYTGDELF